MDLDNYYILLKSGRRSGFMVSESIERFAFEPWPGKLYCVVVRLNSHSASLRPDVQMRTGEVNAVGNSALD